MKKLIKKSSQLLLLLFAFTFLITSCKKDDDSSPTPSPIQPTGTTVKTSVTGRITDTDGNVVSGATIKLGSITTVSDNRGIFLFVNVDVPKTRLVLTSSKPGYFNCIHAKKTQDGAANYTNLVMEAYPAAVNIAGAAGGAVNIPGGAGITFPVNAFVDQNGNAYSGQVKVFARHISPGAGNFEAIVPGGDLSGINTAGQNQTLYSLGMIEAKLFDNSGLNEIKIAPGKTAELKFPIDPSQTASALSTIPMWHLDETTGLWKEEGQATKSGSFFTGNVSHFSIWNCDYSGLRTDIQGKVVDCQNNIMPGIVVTINGFMNVVTDNSGSFTTWVPAGYVIDCQALKIYNPFLIADSPVQTITAIAGQVNIVPPLVVSCATSVSGNLKTCGGSTASPGFVYVSWNGGGAIQYTNNGAYKVFVEDNTPVNIIANYGGFSGSAQIVSAIQGSNSVIPDIQLCTAAAVTQNTFTVNTNGQGSTVFTLSNIMSSTNYSDFNSDGMFDAAYIVIDGIANPGNYDCTITINLNNDNYDHYPLSMSSGNTINIAMDSLWTFGSGYPAVATNNKLFFTDFGLPGGVTTGTYNFDTATGSVTNGEFSVIRTE